MDSSIFSIYNNVDSPNTESLYTPVTTSENTVALYPSVLNKLDKITASKNSDWYKNIKLALSSPSKSINYTEGLYSKNANVNYAKLFFASKGLGISAYGFIGNFLGESGMNPQAINSAEAKHTNNYGAGIYQLTGSRKRAFLELYGKKFENASIEEQLNFAWEEIELRTALLNKLHQIDKEYSEGKLDTNTAIEQATSAVLLGFENGSKNALITPEKFDLIYVNNKNNGKSYLTHLTQRTQYAINAYLS